MLVLVGGAKPAQSILFCREKNLEREIWDGFRYGPEAARETFGFDEAHPIGELDAALPRAARPTSAALFYAVGLRFAAGTSDVTDCAERRARAGAHRRRRARRSCDVRAAARRACG